MASGVLADNATAICNTAVDILGAYAEGAGSGPFAAQIEARRRLLLLRSVREVARLVRATRDGVDEHCRLLIALAVELIARGLSPGDRQLRDLLLPIADRFAGFRDLPEHVQSVFKDDCARESADHRPRAHERSQRCPTTKEEEVATLIEDRRMIVVGGKRDRRAEGRIRRAFRLKNLEWVETRKHESLSDIESMIGRPDVAVVVLLIKRSSHSFGPQLQEYCERHGKPLVRVKAGFHPSQLAEQIMNQCGDRLRQD